MLFKLIVLTVQQKMKEERSISAIYYLLQGKQSIQTIQDAELYEVNHYYGVFKNLSKQRFIEIVSELEKEQYIIRLTKENYYHVSPQGEQWIKDNETRLRDLHVNGKEYKRMDMTFLYRLLLLIQVWTNSKKENVTYIPIIEDKEIELWVKYYYKKSKNNIDHFLAKLYEELHHLLVHIPSYQANMFVSQLTGYQTIGMTTEQLMDKFQMAREDVQLINSSIVHYILRQITNNKEKYTLLFSMTEGLLIANTLTDSAKETNNLLSKGYVINEIANIRRLRKNTIYDHVVEIALHDPQFPLGDYVDKTVENQIIQAIRDLQSYRLKEIKNVVNENITYFQIRLVLAKYDKEVPR